MKLTILTSTLLALTAFPSIASDEPAKKEPDPFDVTALEKRIEETGVPTPKVVQQLEAKAAAFAKDSKWQEAAEAYEAFARSANWLANLIQAGMEPFYSASYDAREHYLIKQSDITFEKLSNDYKEKRNQAMVAQAECFIHMGDTKRAVPILIRSLELINVNDNEMWARARKDLYRIIEVPAATSSNPSPPPPASSGGNPDAFGTEAVKLPETATGTDKYVQGDKDTQNNTGSGAKATQEVRRQPLPRPHPAQVRPGILQERPVGVSNVGQIGVDAHFSQFGDYLQELIDLVQIQWERILTSSSVTPKSSSHVTIKFRINSKGQIAEILKVEGDAGEYGSNAALSAIREPAPYRAWTKEMVAVLGDDQVISFAFYYW